MRPSIAFLLGCVLAVSAACGDEPSKADCEKLLAHLIELQAKAGGGDAERADQDDQRHLGEDDGRQPERGEQVRDEGVRLGGRPELADHHPEGGEVERLGRGERHESKQHATNLASTAPDRTVADALPGACAHRYLDSPAGRWYVWGTGSRRATVPRSPVPSPSARCRHRAHDR